VQLREEIRRIQTQLGITTIYVTHDQEEALSISDHVAVMYGGKIEQVGTPAEMYGAPATPFVAEFIGTMNRLEATIADDGAVEYEGRRVAVDAARGRARGERVLVLVRPEVLEVSPAENGSALSGEVVSHTFLGSVTRVKVLVGEGELTADVPTVRVDSLPVGARVSASFPPASARLLDLSADEPPHEIEVEV
jgi:putative spermidine/putrescine transport system ATP-binding protein